MTDYLRNFDFSLLYSDAAPKREEGPAQKPTKERDPYIESIQRNIADVDRKIAERERYLKENTIPRVISQVSDLSDFSRDGDRTINALRERRASLEANIADIQRSRQQVQDSGGYGEGGFGAALERGLGNFQSTRGALGAAIGDAETEDVENIIQGRQRTLAAGRGRGEQEAYERFQAADGFFASARELFTNPREMVNIAIESLPASALSALGGLVAGGATALATRNPIATRAAAGTGAGLGSFATEYGNAMLETFQSNGVSLDDPESLNAAINDPEIMAEAQERGVRRGIPVAIFDALSFGIAGKVGAPVARRIIGDAATASTTRKVVGNLASGLTEVPLQGALGAAGEATAQLSADGRITSPQDIVAEFAGEIPMGVLESTVGSAIETSRAPAGSREDTELLDALNARASTPTQQTPLLEGPDAGIARELAADDTPIRAGGLNLTPRQLYDFAANNASNPRIAEIMAQPVSPTTKVQQVARVLNAAEASRVEGEVVRRVSGLFGPTQSVSSSKQAIGEVLDGIGPEVVAESSTLSAIRNLVDQPQKGQRFVTGLREIVDGYGSRLNDGQLLTARNPRGGWQIVGKRQPLIVRREGSVIMTQDQVADEAQREREAAQAFRLARLRQERFDRATGTGQQREDLRAGAPEPESQFFLGEAYGELAGTPADIVEAASPNMFRVQYESPSEVDSMGRPLIISEEVSALDLVGRVVRGSSRMTQDLASNLRNPRGGVGTDMNPRRSVDRTRTRAVATQESGPPAVQPNFTMEGLRPSRRAPDGAVVTQNAQQNPTVGEVPAVEGIVESPTQVTGAPPAPQLPAPPRALPAPNVPEREGTTPEAQDEGANIPEQEDVDEEIDIDNDPRMVELNDRFDAALERVQETENTTEARKLAKRLVREGVLDEDAYTDIDAAIRDETDSSFKHDAAMAAIEDAIEAQRDNAAADLESEIYGEADAGNTRFSGRTGNRIDNVGRRFVRASEVVARTQRAAPEQTAETEQKPDIDYDAVIEDRLNKIAERGRQGRVVANRLRGLIQQGGFQPIQIYYAFQMGDVMSRVLPKNASVDVLFVPSIKADNAQAAAASGVDLGEEAGGRYDVYEISQNGFSGLITLSLNEDLLSVARENAAHEAFHVIQDMLRVYDPQASQQIDAAFRDGMTVKDLDPSILRVLKTTEKAAGVSIYDSLLKDFGDTPLAFYEAQAVAFGALVDAKESGSPMRGLKASFIRVADMVSAFRRQMGNILRKEKVRSVAEVFEGYRSGDAQANLGELSAPTNFVMDALGSRADARYSGRSKPPYEHPTIGSQLIAPPVVGTSTIPFLYNNGKTKTEQTPAERLALKDAVQFIQDRSRAALQARFGVDRITGPDPKTDRYLMRAIASEAEAAILKERATGNRSALDWYTKAIEDAIDEASAIYPMLADDNVAQRLSNRLGINSKEDARVIFTTALSITSQNMKVRDNARATTEQVDIFLETGRFDPTKKYGTKAPSISSNLALANFMLERVFDGRVGELGQFLNTEFTVAELNKLGREVQKQAGLDKPPFKISGEMASEKVYGSAIFGPKIGNGFYQNLNRNFSPVTIDLWFMRLWGRLTGTLVGNDTALNKQIESLREAVEADAHPTTKVPDGFVERFNEATDEEVIGLGIELAAEWERQYKALQKQGMTSDEITRQALKPDWAFKAVALAGQRKPNDAPVSGSQRKWIRDVVNGAVKMLAKSGYNVTPADLQALVWYPEKDLVNLLKEGKLEANLNVSYDTAFSELAAVRNADATSANTDARDRGSDGDARQRGLGSAGGAAPAGDQALAARAAQEEGDQVRRTLPANVRDRLIERGTRYSGRTGQDLAAQLRRRFPSTPRVEAGTAGEGNVGRRRGGVLASTVGGRVPVAATYSHSGAVKSVYQESGVDAPDFHELTRGKAAAQLYSRLIKDSKQSNQHGAAVYVYPSKDYEDMRLFVTKDGLAGFALKGDDIVSAFKSPKSNDRGVGFSMVRMAVALGGRRLDAFDTVLPSIYSVSGFRAISRLRWSDEAMDDVMRREWSKETFAAFNNGEPDVVFMAYDENREGIYEPDEGEYTDDYDTAVAMQTAAVRGQRFSGRRGVGLPPVLARQTAAQRVPLRAAPAFTQDDLNFGGNDPSQFEDLVYNLQDKLIDLKKIQQSIVQTGKRIDESADVYKAEERYHGRAAARTKYFVLRELNPLIEDMKAKGVSLEQIDEYLHATHAKERNAQIRKVNPEFQGAGSGMTDAEADAIISGFPKARLAQLKKLGARVRSIVQETQKLMVEYGLETQATIDTWNNTYSNYVPLQREGFEGGGGMGQGFSTRGSSSRRALGSGLPVSDILANIAMQRERVITRGERNRVGNALVALALQNPNDSFWFVIDPKGADSAAAIQKLVQFGIDPDDAANVMGAPVTRTVNKTTGLVEFRRNQLFMNADNVLATRINGEDKFVIFNSRNPRSKRMVESLKNLDVAHMAGFMESVAKFTRYLASINTQYNPVFGLWNLMRDLQGAALNLSSTPLAGKQREVIGDALPAAWGMYRDLRAERRGDSKATNWAALAEEFEMEGGKVGYRNLFRNSSERAEAIEKALGNRGGVFNAASKAAEPVMGWLSDYNEALENGVRLSAYKKAKDMGLSNAEAASIAKNLTVNFNRRGAKTAQIGALYAFFNAGVQGSARLAETLAGPAGKKIIAGGLLVGAMQAVLLSAFDLDDEPDWLKDKNFIIPLGDGKYIPVPMPLGFHAIPAFSRRSIEFLMSGGKNGAEQIIGMMGMFADAFNPIGNSGFSAQTLSPTVTDPFVALTENRDFAGRQIYTEDFNNLDPTAGYERNRQGVSAVGDAIARAIDYLSGGDGYTAGALSPTGDAVDFLIGQLTGGVGREALKVVATTEALITGEDLPNYKIPIVGRLIGDANEPAAVSRRFYEGIKEMNQYKRALDKLADQGKDVSLYIADNPEAEFAYEAQGYESDISELRKLKRQLEDEGAPREEIDAVTEEMQMLMNDFNQIVAEYKR